MINRVLSKVLKNSKKSNLLLGPRQVGKSTLIKSLSPDLIINLSLESTFLSFARNPNELLERIDFKKHKTVFIDEVQRLPKLLNTVQYILDENKLLKFHLTGSSARKLKRGNANLLPGRIHSYLLGPLTLEELDFTCQIEKALSIGTLPGNWLEKNKLEVKKTLRTYASTYLKEEIQSEALTRDIEGFSRFIFIIAAESGKFFDIEKISSQASISRQSVSRYFEILEDTLILNRCNAFSKSTRGRLIQRPKFFLFDTGVLNGLLENFIVSQDRIGVLFEHFIFNQILYTAQSKDLPIRLSSYRTEHGAEVDFILEKGDHLIAIEVKATKNIRRFDLTGFKSFARYYDKPHKKYIVYLGSEEKTIDDVRILPCINFLREIFLL